MGHAYSSQCPEFKIEPRLSILPQIWTCFDLDRSFVDICHIKHVPEITGCSLYLFSPSLTFIITFGGLQGHKLVNHTSNFSPSIFTSSFELKKFQSLYHLVLKSPLSKRDLTNLQPRVLHQLWLHQLL